MVTPLFRAGDEASMIKNPSGRRNFGICRRQGRLRLPDECRPPDGWTSADSSPALKGGVTANVALQAGRGFATAPLPKPTVRIQ